MCNIIRKTVTITPRTCNKYLYINNIELIVSRQTIKIRRSHGIYCKLRFFLLFKYGISVAFNV